MHCGFTATDLFIGGGKAKVELENALLDEPPYYGNDEDDHRAIQDGINLFWSE